MQRLFPYPSDAKRGNCFKDRTGLKFGRLLTLKIAGYHLLNSGKKRLVYKCLCDCGSISYVRVNDLVSMRIQSCGCYATERRIHFNKTTKRKAYGTSQSRVWQSYKNSAKERGLEFSLEREHFLKLTQGNCYYCGREPHMKRKSRNGEPCTFTYNGIDRVDSSIGYTASNCVPCCKLCNRMKMDFKLSEWLQTIIRIYKNRRRILKLIL